MASIFAYALAGGLIGAGQGALANKLAERRAERQRERDLEWNEQDYRRERARRDEEYDVAKAREAERHDLGRQRMRTYEGEMSGIANQMLRNREASQMDLPPIVEDEVLFDTAGRLPPRGAGIVEGEWDWLDKGLSGPMAGLGVGGPRAAAEPPPAPVAFPTNAPAAPSAPPVQDAMPTEQQPQHPAVQALLERDRQAANESAWESYTAGKEAGLTNPQFSTSPVFTPRPSGHRRQLVQSLLPENEEWTAESIGEVDAVVQKAESTAKEMVEAAAPGGWSRLNKREREGMVEDQVKSIRRDAEEIDKMYDEEAADPVLTTTDAAGDAVEQPMATQPAEIQRQVDTGARLSPKDTSLVNRSLERVAATAPPNATPEQTHAHLRAEAQKLPSRQQVDLAFALAGRMQESGMAKQGEGWSTAMAVLGLDASMQRPRMTTEDYVKLHKMGIEERKLGLEERRVATGEQTARTGMAAENRQRLAMRLQSEDRLGGDKKPSFFQEQYQNWIVDGKDSLNNDEMLALGKRTYANMTDRQWAQMPDSEKRRAAGEMLYLATQQGHSGLDIIGSALDAFFTDYDTDSIENVVYNAKTKEYEFTDPAGGKKGFNEFSRRRMRDLVGRKVEAYLFKIFPRKGGG